MPPPRTLCALLSAALLCSGAGLHAQTPVAPAAMARPVSPASVEVYAALPAARAARLSPNGKLLAVIAPVKGRSTLVVWDLDNKARSRAIPTGEFEPEWFQWKSDKRLLAGLGFFSLRDPLRPTHDTRLVALDPDGRNIVNLVDPNQFRTYIPQFQDKVVSLLPDDESHILLELPAVDRTFVRPGETTSIAQYGSQESQVKYPEVVKVDINTGRLQTHARQRAWVVGWRADAAGNVRIGRSLQGRQRGVQVRLASDGSWRSVQAHEVNSGRSFVPLAFVDGQPDHLYAVSNHEGGPAALYEFDATTDSFVRKLAGSPDSAVETVVRGGRLVGYRLGAGSPTTYLDADYAREARLINAALPDSHNDIVDRSADGKRVLFRVVRGNEPPDFWLLDRGGPKTELMPVAESYPGLEPAMIAPGRSVSYKARDGLNIPALLTLPPGRQLGAGGPPLPFVVLPHGGPTSHDTPGFDYLVQFLASRGYGVLQPQFRGSTGYGAAFEKAGQQQWGLAMQDDLTDGTRWLVNEKLADPARIAIVGASYGGYAALMGAVKEPALYRAAAAIAPVTDLNLLNDSDWHFLFSDVNRPRIGTDAEVLERTSPARNVAHIRAPLLLVHGRKDYTVPVAQTERMVEALRKAGKPFDVLYLEEGDHFLSRADDRLGTLRALEKFLAANLQP